MAYPVSFDIQPPERFQKPHVFLRAIVIIILALFAGSIGWILGLLYLAFPVAAAVLISQKGPERFLAESETTITKWLRYMLALYAYMSFLTDRLPTEEPTQTFQFTVRPNGSPTVGSALLRIIYALPHAFVLGIIGLAFIVVLPVAAISILINERVPDWAYGFARGYMRWESRVFAYLASLVEEYPPFSFEDGAVPAETPESAPTTPPSEPPTSSTP
jgi:hypothetical protein